MTAQQRSENHRMYGTGTAREAASIMATTGKNVKQPESLGKGDALNKPAVRKQAPYKLSEVGKKVPLGKLAKLLYVHEAGF